MNPVVLVIIAIAVLAIACALGYALRWRQRPAVTEVPAIPPDDEEIWLSGHGKVTYAQARAIANQTGQQVIVSTSSGGPTPDEQHRIARIEPIITAMPLD